jgi:hypothetical protein
MKEDISQEQEDQHEEGEDHKRKDGGTGGEGEDLGDSLEPKSKRSKFDINVLDLIGKDDQGRKLDLKLKMFRDSIWRKIVDEKPD